MPNGGITLWLELPHRLSSKRVFDAALGERILVAPGAMFSNSNRFDHFLRISCGWRYTREVDDAVRCLGRIVNDLVRR